MSRIVFPFTPNWSSQLQATYSFKTTIFTSRNGHEQRRALRVSPRRTLEFDILLAGDDARRWNRLMMTAQAGPFIMPDYTRQIEGRSVASDQFEIAGEPPAWVLPDTEILLDESVFTTVRSADTGAIYFPAQDRLFTRLYPALTGTLDAELSIPAATSAVRSGRISFEMDPCSDRWITPPAATSFLGVYEVFAPRVQWSGGVPISHKWEIEWLDYGRGRRKGITPIDFPTTTRTLNMVGAQPVLDLFYRAKGRRAAFWLPSGEDDYRLVNPVVSANAASLTVVGTNCRPASAMSLLMDDGRRVNTLIRSITPGSSTTTFTLSGLLPAGGRVVQASAMDLVRFASDDLTVVYLTNRVSTVRASFVTVPDEPGGDAIRMTTIGDTRQTVDGSDRAVIYI